MSDQPNRIEIHEEGPREGFQYERTIYPLAARRDLILALDATGLRQIQVASFVNPERVPQMADAAELFAALPRRADVRHTALWLNEKGFRAAQAAEGVDLVGTLMLYASDPFSRQNNGCGADEMRGRQERWIELYDHAGIKIESAYVMTAFGCHLAGEIPLSTLLENIRWILDRFEATKRPLPAIYLADTVGFAVPDEIERRIGAVRELAPAARVGLHLHDTRGAALANFYAALRLGVDLFDSSVAGLGGCPFAGHAHGAAVGNICTEDLVFLAHEMGIETGIDLEALIQAARMAEQIIGRPLPGRVMHAGSLSAYRKGERG